MCFYGFAATDLYSKAPLQRVSCSSLAFIILSVAYCISSSSKSPKHDNRYAQACYAYIKHANCYSSPDYIV